MHFDKFKSKWRRVLSKLKALSERARDNIVNNGQPAKVLFAVMIAMLSAQSIAAAKNEDRQERKGERQAERAQQKSNNQAVREVKQDNRRAARDSQQDNRQWNKQAQAQNKATQQAQFRANVDAAHNRATADAAQNRAVNKAQNRAAQNRAEERRDDRAAQNRAEERRDDRAAQNRADDRRDDRAARNRADDRRDDRAAQNRAGDRRDDWAAQNRAGDRRDDRRAQNNFKRWDNGLDNRRRYQTYRKYRNNWNEQRTYLNANLSRFNQLANLNQMQQQQLDNQMREAFLSYHHNNWNGSYNWSNYSEPQFLDYLQTRKPSLLQNILSYMGLGGNDDYLYSSDWNNERSQLSRNMANIHQLAVEGRITSAQERQLLDQMRPEFMAYKNNNWDGTTSWSQYSEPGFVDYLNNKQPSILTTVRDYLIR